MGHRRILRRRFNRLTATCRARVRGCGDVATLEHWLDLALSCASVADFEREAFAALS